MAQTNTLMQNVLLIKHSCYGVQWYGVDIYFFVIAKHGDLRSEL